jgi:hypothetical protein
MTISFQEFKDSLVSRYPGFKSKALQGFGIFVSKILCFWGFNIETSNFLNLDTLKSVRYCAFKTLGLAFCCTEDFKSLGLRVLSFCFRYFESFRLKYVKTLSKLMKCVYCSPYNNLVSEVYKFRLWVFEAMSFWHLWVPVLWVFEYFII